MKDEELLKGSSPERARHIYEALTAYRALRGHLAYVSTPVSSGKRLYSVLERKGLATLDELIIKDPDVLRREVIAPNAADGIALTDTIGQEKGTVIVSPAYFQKFQKEPWTQSEYMFLWYRVIEEKVKELYLINNWEFSNGSSQEFLRAMQMQFGLISPKDGMEHFPADADKKKEFDRLRQIKVYNQAGYEVRLDEGTLLIAGAVRDLNLRGFRKTALHDSLVKLVGVGRLGVCTIKPIYSYNLSAMERALEDAGCQ